MGGLEHSPPGLPAAARCLVMGVVNVTPDSFSDGGKWFGPDDAIAHGLELAAAGADIVAVGGESTRPGALRITEAAELRRVGPGVAALARAGVVGASALPSRRSASARGWSTMSAAASPTPEWPG